MAAHADRYPWTKLVTHRYPLDRATEAVEQATSADAMQVVLDPALSDD
jgi:threonine dehydrogenase-like Zn-dependent dehydrogenase